MPLTYFYCDTCADRAWLTNNHEHHVSGDINRETESIAINGIYLKRECITEDEERRLVAAIDSADWIQSQSGRRKQDYGPKANFKKQKCKLGDFKGLPAYIRTTFTRLQAEHELLRDFVPVELCNLEYEPERGAQIDPHLDDTWLWGNRLVTINYLSQTVLTLSKPRLTANEDAIEIAIEMPPRSLLVLYDEARYEWYHAIKRKDVTARRLATTLRELTPSFMPGGDNYEAIGKLILTTAAEFV